MTDKEDPSSPPRTLVGLGPPEPPDKYDAHPTDAPETLRAWSVASDTAASPGMRADDSVDLESLSTRRTTPAFRRSGGSLDGTSRRRPSAALLAVGGSGVLGAVAAVLAIGVSSRVQLAATLGPAVSGRYPSTILVVGGPWVLRQDLEGVPFTNALEGVRAPSRDQNTPLREQHMPPHHAALPGSPATPEEAKAAVSVDQSRIQEIAATVRLEDDTETLQKPAADDPGSSGESVGASSP